MDREKQCAARSLRLKRFIGFIRSGRIGLRARKARRYPIRSPQQENTRKHAHRETAGVSPLNDVHEVP
ncbi:hypothetical protein H0E84_02035 [Luteimonas sp. SJ-92]|uniref:Uncharacterized protein n=1 Tax=Luteimonas salinisoli TaxID=2752307 RepID=A0A853J7R8_9GAMM|nr:hypothetical protein [Luteimonas salinisoli]NZA25151.1 hypothetical protein [Luteimonas salinisoli]